MKAITKHLGGGHSITVTFGDSASQEDIDKFMEQAATGSFGTNDFQPGQDREAAIRKYMQNLKDYTYPTTPTAF